MRLISIELSGFRGFPVRQSIDLDADAVVVVGANGHGKTSLFDGILWALSGRVPRVSSEDARLVSMYSETGQATVALGLTDRTGERYRITRSFDGTEQRLALDTPAGSYRGSSAEGRLIDLIWPEAASASDAKSAISSVLTRCVYLQQDAIRDFVEAASDQDRFSAVSELIGAGRISEFQTQLERAKRAWSSATNQRESELRPLRERLSLLQARASELTSVSAMESASLSSDEWEHWIRDVAALGISISAAESTLRDAPIAIDQSVKRLHALRLSTERRLQEMRSTQAEVVALQAAAAPNVEEVRASLETIQAQLTQIRREVADQQARLAERRQHQAALREKDEQLRALASLALKNLGERCPVCAQTYDRDGTRQRLESLVSTGTGEGAGGSEDSTLDELLSRLTAKENEASAVALALRSAERAASERAASEQSILARLQRLGVATDGNAERIAAITQAILEAESAVAQTAELLRSGEVLAVKASQASATGLVAEVREESERLRAEIAEREGDLRARTETGGDAQRVIERLREAASAVVEQRLNGIGPLLQSVYGRIDPHPAFRAVNFLSRIVRGKGQLATVVADPIESKASELPATVLSSSQVNALAVSVFLALNVALPKPPITATMLDDPLQSLDDINLLGLVDLLRRVKDQRQLLIGTHDPRFGALLSRKLRPRYQNGRTLVVELDGWTRRGPTVKTRQVNSDPVRFRLAPPVEAQHAP